MMLGGSRRWFYSLRLLWCVLLVLGFVCGVVGFCLVFCLFLFASDGSWLVWSFVCGTSNELLFVVLCETDPL